MTCPHNRQIFAVATVEGVADETDREEEETLFFFFIAPLLSKSSSFPFIFKFLSTSMFPSSSAFLLVVGSRARISSERERCVQCEL